MEEFGGWRGFISLQQVELKLLEKKRSQWLLKDEHVFDLENCRNQQEEPLKKLHGLMGVDLHDNVNSCSYAFILLLISFN